MSRKIVIHTGTKGEEQLNKAFKEHVLYSIFEFMYESGEILEEEYSSIKDMINSPDEKDKYLAQQIIKSKFCSNEN